VAADVQNNGSGPRPGYIGERGIGGLSHMGEKIPSQRVSLSSRERIGPSLIMNYGTIIGLSHRLG